MRRKHNSSLASLTLLHEPALALRLMPKLHASIVLVFTKDAIEKLAHDALSPTTCILSLNNASYSSHCLEGYFCCKPLLAGGLSHARGAESGWQSPRQTAAGYESVRASNRISALSYGVGFPG